ncbi:MAG: hypothetical protein ABW000_18975 [Actinoplanes sp.]
MTFINRYGKSVVAVAVATLIVANQAISDDHIDAVEWVNVGIALLTAVSVHIVPLTPQAKGRKTAVAVSLAVLQVLTTTITGGIDMSEIILIGITVAGALGIGVAPARSATQAVGWGPDKTPAPATPDAVEPSARENAVRG